VLKSKPIWDLPVRLMHWSLIATLVAAWASSDITGPFHEVIGYVAGALVSLRLLWGFTGNRYARFTHFLRTPRTTVNYLRLAFAARAPRHLGHNPLGGWMIVMLLACVAMLVATGWALTTDALWGYAWPIRVHAAFAWLLLVLVVFHVSGVLWTSWQHRENLVAAMFTGKKADAQGDDVD
jgi:cytochrome b